MSTEEATTHLNGAAGQQADPLDLIAAQLEEEKAPITARRAQLEAEIAELARREGRIDAALLGLRGKTATAPSTRAKGPRDSHDWKPSQKTLDDIYAAIVQAERNDAEATVNYIVGQTNVSSSTVKKALDYLRSEQKVRITGTAAQQGSPKTYGTMP